MVETVKRIIVPAALNHWSSEALKANQELLDCLNVYPGPTGVGKGIVPSIQRKLAELRKLNHQIATKCSGWLNYGEG